MVVKIKSLWCRKISVAIPIECEVCPRAQAESLVHRFYECPKVFSLWSFAQSMLHRLNGEGSGPHQRFSWRICIFGKTWPRKYKSKEHIRSVLRGAVLRQSWIARNARVFANEDWPSTKLQQAVWDSLVDAGRVAGAKAQAAFRRNPGDRPRILRKFDHRWMFSDYLGQREDDKVIWFSTGPPDTRSYNKVSF